MELQTDPEVNKRIIDLLVRFRTSVRTSSEKYTYKQCQSYTLGVVNALNTIYPVDLVLKIGFWYNAKTNTPRQILWTHVFMQTHKDRSEEELVELFAQTIEDFFRENPDWYKEKLVW